MTVVAMEEVLSDLGPHLTALHEIARGAWDDYQARIPADCQIIFCPRTRASAVHNFMVDRAVRYAEENSNSVRYFDHNLMLGLVLCQRYAVRFKKLDSEGRSRNQPTRQVAEFRSQKNLDGFPESHHLELGYVLDDTGQDVAEVRLVSPSGAENTWWCALSPAGATATVVELPGFEAEQEVEEADVVPRESVVLPFVRKTDES